MKKSYRTKSGSLKKTALGVVSVVLAVFVLLALLEKFNVTNLNFWPFKENRATSTGSNDINYDPPTEEEKNETEEFKKDLGESETTPSQPPAATTDQKKSVTPVISSWGQNSQTKDAEVSGFVPGIVESGGTCTLTMKKGDQSVSETRNATADAKTVSCGLISISRARLSAGSWTATISYSSASSEGTSQSVTLGVE